MSSNPCKRSRIVRAAIFASAILTMLGCMTVQFPGRSVARSAAPLAIGADTEVAQAVWPPRWGDERPGLGKGVIVEVNGPLRAWSPSRHGPWHQRLPRDGDEHLVLALARGRTDEQGYLYRMEGPGAFVFDRDPRTPAPPLIPRRREDPSFMFVFASGRNDGEERGRPRVEIQRTWFAYYDHRRDGRSDRDEPGLGTVMFMPGLFGVPEFVMELLVQTMRQRGWNVVRMLAPPAGFVARSELTIDPGGNAPESARRVARELMDRIAESAYAAEAALEHVLDRRPALRARPKVILGGSAGAMALPAAVLRSGAYDGAVLIAGGGNILEIITRSSYTRPVNAMDFRWIGFEDDARPDRETLDRVAGMYLDHAPLDPLHASAALQGMPVLMLHASGDDAIPPDTGDRLWKALGEPERWIIQGNHLTLFLSLWTYGPRIMDWLERNTVGVEP
jgi:alpha-beta hydrolase superfamily lysophospholipase